MASKSGQDQSASADDVEEMLDTVDNNLERVKTLYEQYFLGIQKQPPTFLHTDIERKLRDLTQLQIRNTGLRYRFATLQQKFGAYNSYWKRTLRQIENGTYIRNLSKIGRDAIRTGAPIPEEILAAMPKRMREQVVRDRDAAIAIARRRKLDAGQLDDDAPADTAGHAAALATPASASRAEPKTRAGAFVLDGADDDMDFDAFFSGLESDGPVAQEAAEPKRTPAASLPAPPMRAPPTAPGPGGVPTPIAAQPSRPVVKPPPVPPKAPGGQPPPLRPQTGPYPSISGTASPPAPKHPPSNTPGVAARSTGQNPVLATPPVSPPKPAASAPSRPPPGMSDADVNALYAKYVQAKQMVGEATGPKEREKLLRTINAQAPKIMEQYKAKGVDFSVVVKDNQVIIRAKPKP